MVKYGEDREEGARLWEVGKHRLGRHGKVLSVR